MRSSFFKCLFMGLLLLMWGSVHWLTWPSNQTQAKSNWIQSCSLRGGYTTVGCSKKNLVTGYCSTVNHFRLRKTPKHGEDAVAVGSLAYRGCVLALWTKWRKGIVWPFLNPSHFEVALACWKLCQPTRLRSYIVLLCSVLEVAFENQMGSIVPRNWVSLCCSSGFFQQSAIIQRCFHSQYPTDQSLTALSLSFTFLLQSMATE